MAHGNMVSETRGGDTPGSGPRAAIFASGTARATGHVEPRNMLVLPHCSLWPRVFSTVCACFPRGLFAGRPPRVTSPVPGPYKRRAESKTARRAALSKKGAVAGHCGAHASIHHAPRHILRAITANPSMIIMKHNIKMTTTAFPKNLSWVPQIPSRPAPVHPR